MRELEIDEIEFLEDFYTELNLNAIKEDDTIYLRKNDNYQSCIYILKDVKNDKIELEGIAYLGFKMKHPAIVSLYKDILFDVDDFREFLEADADIEKMFFDREYSFGINQEFILKGINLQKIIEYNMDNDELYFINAPVLYFSKIDSDRKFRAMFFQTEGMCGSGYCSASWGNYSFWEIEEFPEEFDLKPTKNHIIKIVGNGTSNNDSFQVLLGKELSLICFSEDGGDGYYPNGYVDFYSFDEKVLEKDFEINKNFKMNKFLTNKTDFYISLDPSEGYDE